MKIKRFSKTIKTNNLNGQSLFEIVIALFVMGLVIISIVSLGTLSVKSSLFSKSNTTAARISQETMEWLKQQKGNDWGVIKAKSFTPVWCMPDLNWENAISTSCSENDLITGQPLYRELRFNQIYGEDQNSLEVKVVVWWNDSKGFHETSTATMLTNWESGQLLPTTTTTASPTPKEMPSGGWLTCRAPCSPSNDFCDPTLNLVCMSYCYAPPPYTCTPIYQCRNRFCIHQDNCICPITN